MFIACIIGLKSSSKGSKPKVGSVLGQKSVPYSGYVVTATVELLMN